MFREIYVLYPRGVRTGGPEALHQLVSTLRELGQDAYLVPRPGTEHLERVPEFASYGAPERPRAEDAPGSAVVASEYALKHLHAYTRADRFCWWLSIDNSPLFRSRIAPPAGLNQRTPLSRRLETAARGLKRRLAGDLRLVRSIGNLAQSHYAWAFLYSTLGIRPSALSDYTTVAPLPQAAVPILDRGMTVAFNPKKAAAVTSALQARFREPTYVPLQGMSPGEVRQALSRSAVYLDLGYHPGKDRMPREAALSGAVTLVARRGSGAYYADVPIPMAHKIEPDERILESSIRALEWVFEDPAGSQARQDPYRRQISLERETFRREAEAIFVHGRRGFDSIDPIA
ncbi:hypothetical protein [Naasia sp. SYSU D00948]|uniref:hypothetical protein n=1 Tax=Naasia sp. SYSU D00948 TaxID=2817379 RepID=UPI001B30A1B4|nr:hypothetical protein [Naasia sp. SYSU D00948]